MIQKGCWTPIEYFSTDDKTHWFAEGLNADQRRFTVYEKTHKQAEVHWDLIGKHNRNNPLAALLAARHVGVPLQQASSAMSTFKNVKRRLEILGCINGITIYDDFAHHPTAIATTIQALRHRVALTHYCRNGIKILYHAYRRSCARTCWIVTTSR